MDIFASFEVDKDALASAVEADVGYNCTTSRGGAGRGALGPFGLLVFADKSLSELTPVYFYIAKGTDGKAHTHFCSDESRSLICFFNSCALGPGLRSVHQDLAFTVLT